MCRWDRLTAVQTRPGVRRLLVQAYHTSSNKRATHIEHAVSDAFVVATQRVKQAQKSEIPHMEEHVSKLEFVGVQTQLKLQDIRGAAAAVGVVGLSVLHNCITTGVLRGLCHGTSLLCNTCTLDGLQGHI